MPIFKGLIEKKNIRLGNKQITEVYKGTIPVWKFAKNYFGDGTNGSLSTTGNVTLTVPNKNGSLDGDMVVRNYTSLTINSNHTFTTDQPCRGLLIYVQGNCTINGTLTMTARGASANPTVNGASDSNLVNSLGLRFPFLTASGTNTISTSNVLLNGCGVTARNAIAKHPSLSSNGTILTIPRQGANGATPPSNPSNANGLPGVNGTNGSTGGGGSGGLRNGTSGPGSFGSCFSGGSGGGGLHFQQSFNSVVFCAGQPWGGSGGPGYNGTGSNEFGGGGAGNNGGLGGFSSGMFTTFNNDTASKGQDGTGGLIVLIVGGTLTIGSGGSIRAQGSQGGTRSAAAGAGGGGSGGGSINLIYTNISNSGTITAAGGPGGPQPNFNWNPSNGGAGGSGSIQQLQVLPT